jgi:hypothetical protein
VLKVAPNVLPGLWPAQDNDRRASKDIVSHSARLLPEWMDGSLNGMRDAEVGGQRTAKPDAVRMKALIFTVLVFVSFAG